MRTVEQIEKEIKELKEQRKNIKGKQTEVYTRIVGYYRSIKNWNKGKREEYNFRKPYARAGEQSINVN
jgi:anaerobic ribonucleoside-triphosphate reductase